MGYFEADKGRLGVYSDVVFAKLGFGAGQTNYRNPIAGLRITTTTSAALTYQLFIVEMGAVYELQRWSGAEGSFTAVDALGGFRYWNNSIAASFGELYLRLECRYVGYQRGLLWADHRRQLPLLSLPT